MSYILPRPRQTLHAPDQDPSEAEVAFIVPLSLPDHRDVDPFHHPGGTL